MVIRQTCTTLVPIAGLDELCSAVNVRRFMQIKSNCQWIKVFTYVDDVLLPEPCPDSKYLAVDIQESDYELLSMPFKLNNLKGKIQVVVKTFGPGKKWPDYSFTYDYCDMPARLIPSRTASRKSFDFRDVVKRSENLMDKLSEVQYTAEDRLLREKIETEEEEKRKALDLAEMIKRSPAETVKVIRRRSVTPEDEGQIEVQVDAGSSNSSKRVRVPIDTPSTRQGQAGLSQDHQGGNIIKAPAPLMRNGRDLSKAPILDRRW